MGFINELFTNKELLKTLNNHHSYETINGIAYYHLINDIWLRIKSHGYSMTRHKMWSACLCTTLSDDDFQSFMHGNDQIICESIILTASDTEKGITYLPFNQINYIFDSNKYDFIETNLHLAQDEDKLNKYINNVICDTELFDEFSKKGYSNEDICYKIMISNRYKDSGMDEIGDHF